MAETQPPHVVPTFSIEDPKTWTVLVVDDEVDNRTVAEMILRFAGITVVTSDNGSNALAQLEQAIPSLVLLDLSMPVMDGWETIKRIRADAQWQHLPVIAVTAHAMFGDRATVLKAGFDGYINKPVRVATFVNEIQRLLHLLPNSV